MNGLFWILQVPDNAVTISGDTLTISLTNASVVDQIQFPGGTGNNLGIAGAPATVSFNITYAKSGTPRQVRPTSRDRLSPFAWAGEMWTATNSGTFSLAYNDGTFSAQGSFSSSGNFGEMGTERNGSFAEREARAAKSAPLLAQNLANLAGSQWDANAEEAANSPKFKGRLPVRALIH
jgi:hypothetical protein